jgi:hypothetical protein
VDDRALYQTILGLQDPWVVERVELRTDPQEVDVWVSAMPGTTFSCPQCGQASPIYDHVGGLVKKCVNARQAAAFWVGETAGTSTPST